MKRKIFLLYILLITNFCFGQIDNSIGSLPPFTKWYQNPLGISPIALHTGNGFILPAIATGVILLFTGKDTALQNQITIYGDLGFSKGYYGSFSTLYHQNLGINFMLRKYMSTGVEFTQVYVKDDVNNVAGLGIRPFFRFYPINSEKLKLYFSSGAGLIYFFKNYPQPSGFFDDYREGTKWNGCPKYGVATEIKLNSKLYLSAGLWHIHFSNGDHPSFTRNPGHDSNGLSIGISYKP